MRFKRMPCCTLYSVPRETRAVDLIFNFIRAIDSLANWFVRRSYIPVFNMHSTQLIMNINIY